jgi:hypothetical protein
LADFFGHILDGSAQITERRLLDATGKYNLDSGGGYYWWRELHVRAAVEIRQRRFFASAI